MTMTRWWKVAAILFAVGAATSGVVALVGKGAAVAEARGEDTPGAVLAEGAATLEVKPGTLRVVVEERGNLEASRNADAFCMVEGQSTIISLVPEGTRVTKGQLVCELDSAALKDRLTNQVISLKSAEAAYDNAKLAREVAELALTEYVEGVYRTELGRVSGEVLLARSAVTKAEDRLKRTRSARDRLNAILAAQGGTKTTGDVLAALDIEDRFAAAELALPREQFSLEDAETRRNVLERFTKARTVKQHRNEVEKARADELARQAAHSLERSREARLLRQIADCKVLAPADGVLVYANDPFRPGARRSPQIEEGATIRERQKIFSIPDLDRPFRAAVKVPEAIVDRIARGLPARVKVDAIPNETFPGIVEAIAPLPDPTTSFNSAAKVYTTTVALKKGIPGLRPGMTAGVEIVVATLENVLSVPVHSVVLYDNTHHVAVKTPDGRVDWHDVTLGLSNDTSVEVKAGLNPGDTVVLEPAPLLSEDQKRSMTLTPSKPAPGSPGQRAGQPKAKRK